MPRRSGYQNDAHRATNLHGATPNGLDLNVLAQKIASGAPLTSEERLAALYNPKVCQVTTTEIYNSRRHPVSPAKYPVGTTANRSTKYVGLGITDESVRSVYGPGRTYKGATKKALLVGITYRGQGDKELYGSINDVRCLEKWLVAQGFNDIRMLTEDSNWLGGKPTAANIKAGINWLTSGVRSGDSLFFGYSGHGTRIADTSGDEADGMDECMLALDGEKIVDDYLYEALVGRVPPGAKLTCITDCCHSGTILDLPYITSAGKPEAQKPGAKGSAKGDVYCFSACKDTQTSSDVNKGAGVAGGACTNSLLNSLSEVGQQPSFGWLLKAMQTRVKRRGFDQIPQLSSNKPVDLYAPFSVHANSAPLVPPPKGSGSTLNPYSNYIVKDAYAAKAGPGVKSKGFFSDFADAMAEPQQEYQQPSAAQGGGDSGIRCDVRMISGCRDDQTSADVSNVASFGLPPNTGPGGAGGACTNAMMSVVHSTDPSSWIDLLGSMRQVLSRKGYSQIPQLSSGQVVDLREDFSVTAGPGRRKALMVGINYIGQRGELRGCINDVKIMKEYLESQGYNDFNVLTEDDSLSSEPPTAQAIINGMRWLIDGAEPGDNLFFHYSGHGGQAKDRDGEEADGMDETLIPLDYQTAGQIRDDVLLKDLVLPLPEGVQLYCLMDCCHSGTVMDLPYLFRADDAGLSQPEPIMQTNPSFKWDKIGKIAEGLLGIFMGGDAGGLGGAIGGIAEGFLGGGGGGGFGGFF